MCLCLNFVLCLFCFTENPMDDYLQYVGGTFGLAAITGAAAATALYVAYSPTPMFPKVDINNQSLEVPVCIFSTLEKVMQN